MTRHALLLAALLVLAPLAAVAQVDVTAPWARATAPGAQTGAAYLTLAAPAGDRLVGAETPVARTAELHTHLMEGGIARMREVDAVEVPAGRPVALAPGGLHVMLIGLNRQLRRGETFPLILVFEKAGRVAAEVRVEGPGAQGPSAHHGH